ncbi:MAG: A/G-specific adenine glycosylase [Bacteroidota bacterium]|nr:A/G-specific adenine glycosylase [Bacteroidota bacterium]
MRSAKHVISPTFPTSRQKNIHRQLLRWYARHARVLPWRDIDNPYYVFVSEFMLQQTQVARVLEHFPQWVARFPDVASLAAASKRDVLLAWSGMGYNRRALQLHDAARMIRDAHGGVIPQTPAALQQLPGIGRYTAAAIACFGYRRRHPVVDINIRRVLSRLSADMRDTATMLAEPVIWQTAALLLPQRAYYHWNQGLMDLGATICTARRPLCDHCPLRSHCPSSGRLKDPVPSARNAVRETPRRIYRGRVVEELRSAPGHCRSAARLGALLYENFSPEQRPLLLDILATLQRDGMVRAHAGGRPVVDIRTYSAALERLRICLAE